MTSLPTDGPAGGAIPLAEFRERVLALYAPPLRARKTLGKMTQVLNDLCAMEGLATTADLTTSAVARFVASRPAGEHPNTTYGLLSYLRAACAIAEGEGWVRVSPFRTRRRWTRRVAPTPPAHHSREDLARVLDLARADVAEKSGWARWRARRTLCLLATVAFTGIRRNEALYLRVEVLDLGRRILLINARVGNRLKTEAAAAPVPIPDALAPTLAGWLEHRGDPPAAPDGGLPSWLHVAGVKPPGVIRSGGPADGDTPQDVAWLFPNCYGTGPWTGGSPGFKPLDRLKALGRRAGLKAPLTFQSLRHSWATHAETWGLNDAQIQRVLRHTNLRTQWHYRHADLANLRSAVGSIDFGPAAADNPGGAP